MAKWMQSLNIKKGGLHKSLGVPMGQKIPKKKIDVAAKKGGKIGAQARLAEVFRKANKHKGK
jgi:hypothetical protein